jgi:hypothetical protein
MIHVDLLVCVLETYRTSILSLLYLSYSILLFPRIHNLVKSTCMAHIDYHFLKYIYRVSFFFLSFCIFFIVNRCLTYILSHTGKNWIFLFIFLFLLWLLFRDAMTYVWIISCIPIFWISKMDNNIDRTRIVFFFFRAHFFSQITSNRQSEVEVYAHNRRFFCSRSIHLDWSHIIPWAKIRE